MALSGGRYGALGSPTSRPPVTAVAWARARARPLSLACAVLAAAFALVVLAQASEQIRRARHEHGARLHRYVFGSARTVQALQRSYRRGCGGQELSPAAARAVIAAIVGEYDGHGALDGDPFEHGAVQVGTEMWNRLSLHETVNPYLYYADDDDGVRTDTPIPYVLSYGRRLDQGRQALAQVVTDPDLVSYPSVDDAYEARDYLSMTLFRNAASMTQGEFRAAFSGRQAGALLATLNQWVVLERLANGTYAQDEVVVVEDDVFLVPDFQRKLAVLRAQLATVPWDVVFLGTCLGITNTDRVTANLHRTRMTRCFNMVLLHRSAAEKILARGAIVSSYEPVDWLFDRYIVDLDLKAYYAEPPLAYEQSKMRIQMACGADHPQSVATRVYL